MTELKVKMRNKSSTPLVDSLFEPSYFQIGNPQVIYKRDLEDVLEKLTVVYGSPDTPRDELAWSNQQLDCDTHTARLLGVTEIKRESVKTKEQLALEFVEDIWACGYDKLDDVVKKANEIMEIEG